MVQGGHMVFDDTPFSSLSVFTNAPSSPEATSLCCVNAGTNVMTQIQPMLNTLKTIIKGDDGVTLCPILQKRTLNAPRITSFAIISSQFTIPSPEINTLVESQRDTIA